MRERKCNRDNDDNFATGPAEMGERKIQRFICIEQKMPCDDLTKQLHGNQQQHKQNRHYS